jgi:hypothetical protein
VLPLSFCQRIACAAATLFGPYGAVTRLTQEYGLGRPSLYRQTDDLRDELQAQTHRQEVLRLRQQLQHAQARGDDWQRRLDQAVLLDQDRQAEFAATAQATGVRLPVARRLLHVFLGQRTPSVAKLGRWTRAAALRCAALLQVLDEHTGPRVRQAVADEIFVRRQPILMVVEPGSLCWVSGRRVARRDGVTWAEELGRLPALAQVPKDGGTGLAKGLAQTNAQRRQRGQTPAAEQDDHFHVLRDGQQALRLWRASSGVEGINSVLRMQQSRHRRLTQGLLELKRLYWNCQEFRTGKRKGQSPSSGLGVPLPELSWWQLLKLSPEQLRQLLPPTPCGEPTTLRNR